MFAEVVLQTVIYIELIARVTLNKDSIFIFQGKKLKSYSHKTLRELGIKNNSKILVIDPDDCDNPSIDDGKIPKAKPLPFSKEILHQKKDVNPISSLKKEKEYQEDETEEEKNEKKKFDLNIIYYDENLKNEENNDNCTFFDINTNGTFYGCHYFELFKIICEKIKSRNKEFILISSGSCSKKVFNYCKTIKEIREYYIYCFNLKKYKPLMKEYSKLQGVYDDFDDLKEKLYSIKPIKISNMSSSNLIFFEDYSKSYIKLHYEFIRKYYLYKILKSKNCNESQFLELVKEEHPSFLNLAKQLFPKTKEIINFFKSNVDEKEEVINKVFKADENILKDNVKAYIRNYTAESFYYKYLNKFLREGDFNAFRILSSHVAKFIYKLYEFREKNSFNDKPKELYRKMYLDPKEIKLYKNSTGKVICYPSFTSTSLNSNFSPIPYNDIVELVLLKIETNNTKSTISISKFSKFEEEEYLFLPFSFFKIKKIELKDGTEDNPHIIYLIALSSDKPIEEMFVDFMEKETDNLNPEGLDLLLLENNNEKIIMNPIYLSKIAKSISNIGEWEFI